MIMSTMEQPTDTMRRWRYWAWDREICDHAQGELIRERMAKALRMAAAYRLEWLWESGGSTVRWWEGDLDDVLDLRSLLLANGFEVLGVSRCV